MRIEFITEYEATSRYFAMKIAPWAAKLMKVEGGWRAFESVDDYTRCKNER